MRRGELAYVFCVKASYDYNMADVRIHKSLRRAHEHGRPFDQDNRFCRTHTGRIACRKNDRGGSPDFKIVHMAH